MKIKKTILFIFLMILLSTFIYAVKPVSNVEFEGVQGINVNVNIMDYYAQGENRYSIIHLFNATSGEQMTPDTHPNIICTIYLRNSQGFEIMTNNATPHENHWDLNGSSGNMTPLGVYAWTLACNDDVNHVGGYSSGIYQITEGGYEDDKTVFLTLIIGVLGFSFLLLYISFNLEKVHILLKLLILFSVVFLQVYLGYVVSNLVSFTIYESVGFIFYNAILWFIRIFTIYIFVYFIYSMFQYFETIPKIKGWKKKK